MNASNIFDFHENDISFKTNDYWDNMKYGTRQVQINLTSTFKMAITSVLKDNIWTDPKVYILQCEVTPSEISKLCDILEITKTICDFMIILDKKAMNDFLENIQKNLVK